MQKCALWVIIVQRDLLYQQFVLQELISQIKTKLHVSTVKSDFIVLMQE